MIRLDGRSISWTAWTSDGAWSACPPLGRILGKVPAASVRLESFPVVDRTRRLRRRLLGCCEKERRRLVWDLWMFTCCSCCSQLKNSKLSSLNLVELQLFWICNSVADWAYLSNGTSAFSPSKSGCGAYASSPSGPPGGRAPPSNSGGYCAKTRFTSANKMTWKRGTD